MSTCAPPTTAGWSRPKTSANFDLSPIPMPELVGSVARLRHGLLGEPPARQLVVVHCLHTAAEAAVAVSLAGSLFFNVSVDAARPRVLLYLAVTMAPFVILAPIIGPLIDRVGAARRIVLALTLLLRAGAAILLSANLRSLLLFPLAFSVLVFGRTYSIARNAFVPVVVPERGDLVAENSRLIRTGTLSGGLGASAAVAVSSVGGGPATLVLAAVLYGAGTVATLFLPAGHNDDVPVNVDVEATELVARGATSALLDMAALRAAVGFVVFHLGFSLRTAGASPLVFGLVIAANGAGNFVGTIVATWLRRHLHEQRMLTIALVTAAASTVTTTLRFTTPTLVFTSFGLGLSFSIGRRAFDSILQSELPEHQRGRAFASFETRIELAWVAGGLVAVVMRASSWLGLLILAWFLLTAATAHVNRLRQAGHLMAAGHDHLPSALLARSRRLGREGRHAESAINAVASIETEAARRDLAVPIWLRVEMDRLRRDAVSGDDDREVRAAVASIDLAERALNTVEDDLLGGADHRSIPTGVDSVGPYEQGELPGVVGLFVDELGDPVDDVAHELGRADAGEPLHDEPCDEQEEGDGRGSPHPATDRGSRLADQGLDP